MARLNQSSWLDLFLSFFFSSHSFLLLLSPPSYLDCCLIFLLPLWLDLTVASNWKLECIQRETLVKNTTGDTVTIWDECWNLTCGWKNLFLAWQGTTRRHRQKTKERSVTGFFQIAAEWVTGIRADNSGMWRAATSARGELLLGVKSMSCGYLPFSSCGSRPFCVRVVYYSRPYMEKHLLITDELTEWVLWYCSRDFLEKIWIQQLKWRPPCL